MVETKISKERYKIPFWKQALQVPARFFVDKLFPHQQLDPDSQRNLEEAGQLLDQGWGIVVPITHFAKPEFMYLFSTLFSDSSFSRAGGLMPLGRHECHWYIVQFARSVGVETMPVVVQSTKKTLQGVNLGDGYNEFQEIGGERLSQAGVVVTIPQLQRETNLGKPKSSTVFGLIDDAEYSAEQTNIDSEKIAVLPIGIGLTGRKRFIGRLMDYIYKTIKPEKYKKSLAKSPYADRGFHFFEEGNVTIRPPITKSRLYEITDGDLYKIEQVVFDEFAQAVPENYL